MIPYIEWHLKMDKLSNEELVRVFLRESPMFGEFGELCDLVAERLCPGIMDKLGDEAEAMQRNTFNPPTDTKGQI